MRPERDYYEVLGVERDADAKTIKRAFLKLARKLHPDVNDSPDAESQFKEVNEAYSVLSDDRKRSNYDRFGDAEGPGGFGADYVDMSDIFGGFGMGDIFDSFFGGRSAAGQRAARTAGRDVTIRLAITLEEAAAGCSKTISYNRLAPCDDCSGTGLGEGGAVATCDRCHGSGRVVEVQQTIFGQMQSQRTCPACGGSGQKIEHPCETCDGQGRTPSKETVTIDIAPGVRAGAVYQMPEKGEAGIRGARSGDLIVGIEIAPHERFERRGDDLICRISVNSLEAIVGTTVEVAGILPDETIAVVVPAGTQYGAQLVVENAGMPRSSGTRGRLVALVEVMTPADLTDEQLEHVRSALGERA